jgi:hypothetical protein
MGKLGELMTGSSLRGMFKKVVNPKTTVMRKMTRVNW